MGLLAEDLDVPFEEFDDRQLAQPLDLLRDGQFHLGLQSCLSLRQLPRHIEALLPRMQYGRAILNSA